LRHGLTAMGERENLRLAAMVRAMAPGSGLSARINGWRFRRAGRHHATALAPLLSADPVTSTGQAVDARPELLSFVRAPYLCAGWSPDERLNRLTTHFATLDRFPPLNFPVAQSINLMPLPMIGETYHVVIDKPMWFHREGVLTINLFDGDWRLFSLVFALEPTGNGLRALIGGIQGRNFDDALDRYRDLTKAAHGLRPRDLLIELFRLVCAQLGVTEILAIADKGRQNRHPYFGKEMMRTLPLDYDAIWQDRGGAPISEWFYRLPLTSDRRSDADIPAKKRSMYRQRYAMLDAIEAGVRAGWAMMTPITRPDAL
jgi:uncharacterized protein